MVRVLIVDDSALMRQILTKILSSDPEIDVVGSAPDPFVARQKIKELNPDVITMDVEMPRMDGLTMLEKIMRLRPTPVVMISTLTQKGANTTLQALELGAVDFIGKPTIDVQNGWDELRDELIAKIKAASGARVTALTQRPGVARSGPLAPLAFGTTDKVVAIGASTGGVEALRTVIGAMPADGPPILIVQHMPQSFTERFAERLDGLSAMSVSEAADRARVLPGHAYIAPGNRHLRLVRSGAQFQCQLADTAPVSGHRPSADVLFGSMAESAGANAVGVILTGMGKDGAAGLLRMRQVGAATMGQNEATCLVYGMPRAAAEAGAVMDEYPLSRIAGMIAEACRATRQKASA